MKKNIKLKYFLLIYLFLTIIFYNNFFGIFISSRIPIIVFTIGFAPYFLINVINGRFRYTKASLKYFMFIYSFLALEIIHFIVLGGYEILGIISLVGIVFLSYYVKENSASYQLEVISFVCLSYIIFFYALVYAHNWVGAYVYDKGVFISQLLPFLSPFVIGDTFNSGRGVMGLMGGTLAIIETFKMFKNEKNNSYVIFKIFSGVFAVLISDSRGVIVAFIIIFLIIIFPLSKQKKVKLFYSLPIFIFLLNPLIIGYTILNGLSSEIFTIIDRTGISSADNGRVIIWLQSISLIGSSFNSFVLGFGDINSSVVLEENFKSVVYYFTSAHNLFLQLFLDGGIVLVLVFLIWLIVIFKHGIKFMEKINLEGVSAVAALSFLLIYAFSGSTLSLDRVNESMILFLIIYFVINKKIIEVNTGVY